VAGPSKGCSKPTVCPAGKPGAAPKLHRDLAWLETLPPYALSMSCSTNVGLVNQSGPSRNSGRSAAREEFDTRSDGDRR